uniref:Putative secreted protein n=1 Tax=Ixodes ricinus TaxID=34613 RepID=A0A6B0UDU4_IXORI
MPSRWIKALVLPVAVCRLAVASAPRHLPSVSPARTDAFCPNASGHLKWTGTAVAPAAFVFSHPAPWHRRSGDASKSVVPTD